MESVKRYHTRKRRVLPRIRSTEVLGQCTTCLDTFNVTLVLAHGEIIVQETPRLRWFEQEGQPLILIHHPTYCHGKVKLYGSLTALYPQPDEHLEPILA